MTPASRTAYVDDPFGIAFGADTATLLKHYRALPPEQRAEELLVGVFRVASQLFALPAAKFRNLSFKPGLAVPRDVRMPNHLIFNARPLAEIDAGAYTVGQALRMLALVEVKEVPVAWLFEAARRVQGECETSGARLRLLDIFLERCPGEPDAFVTRRILRACASYGLAEIVRSGDCLSMRATHHEFWYGDGRG